MRKIKCDRCGKQSPQNEVFRVHHISASGKKYPKKYCTEECYKQEREDAEMLKMCQYFIDDVLGYMCVNNQKNKSLKELTDAGYTRRQVYDCMTEMKQKIEESLMFRSDISNEGHKILYIYSIIRNNIKEITDRNINSRLKKDNNEYIEHHIGDVIVNKKINNIRVGLMDIIGGCNE